MTKLKTIFLEPSSFPQDVVDEWCMLVDEHLERPSETGEGALLGVDIAYMLSGAGGYPLTEIGAFFFKEDDLCRGHVVRFPDESAALKCHMITETVDDCYMHVDLICKLFHHCCWPGKQLQTLIFRDFTLFYDAAMMDDSLDLTSKLQLILHDQPLNKDLRQLEKDIEMCLEGFTDAMAGLEGFRFVVNLGEAAGRNLPKRAV